VVDVTRDNRLSDGGGTGSCRRIDELLSTGVPTCVLIGLYLKVCGASSTVAFKISYLRKTSSILRFLRRIAVSKLLRSSSTGTQLFKGSKL